MLTLQKWMWKWYNISCRRINTNPLISEWIWADTNNEGYQQKVLSQILSQLGPGGWRGETIFQTAGKDHLQITMAPFSSWRSRIIRRKKIVKINVFIFRLWFFSLVLITWKRQFLKCVWKPFKVELWLAFFSSESLPTIFLFRPCNDLYCC